MLHCNSTVPPNFVWSQSVEVNVTSEQILWLLYPFVTNHIIPLQYYCYLSVHTNNLVTWIWPTCLFKYKEYRLLGLFLGKSLVEKSVYIKCVGFYCTYCSVWTIRHGNMSSWTHLWSNYNMLAYTSYGSSEYNEPSSGDHNVNLSNLKWLTTTYVWINLRKLRQSS